MNISHSVNCKICHKPFFVQVDPEYDIVADAHKLFPMATCNRCYDYTFNRRKIIVLIFTICSVLSESSKGRNLDPEKERKYNGIIHNYANRFCDTTENYYRRKEPEIRSGLADDLISNPDKVDVILKAYMAAFRNASPPELIPATVDEGLAKE